MRKVTVIGGSGFVGSNLCSFLRKLNVSFEILDLKKSKRFPKETKIVDIRKVSSIKNKISGDIVIHLAAVHSDNVFDSDEYYQTNVKGTKNIIAECEKKNIKRIIFTSSVAVYGYAEPETNENGLIKPFNEYGRTKFLAEELLRDCFKKRKSSLTLSIIRPTVIFGEGNRGNVYNLFNQIASGKFLMIGNGRNKKSLAYIGNFVPFITSCIKSKEPYELINYTDKPDLDMNTFTLLVKKHLNLGTTVGIRVPYFLGLLIGVLFDIFSYVLKRKSIVSSLRIKKFCSSTCFSSKSKKALEFKPHYSLEEGIFRTLESEFIKPQANREIFFTE